MFNVIKALLQHGGVSKTGHLPVPPGLEAVGTELSELAIRFGRLVCHNAMTYKPFYHEILESTEQM